MRWELRVGRQRNAWSPSLRVDSSHTYCGGKADCELGAGGTQKQRLGEAILGLDVDRPRPALNGRTAVEVFAHDRIKLPDRQQLRRKVETTEERWLDQARPSAERDKARRTAIEEVSLTYNPMHISGGGSRNYDAETQTT